jgi:N6-L-threonylcarbamoyladenine synthase
MYVLGIESSCDETAVAIYHDTRGLLAHALYSQVALHREYGGVVPELASRDHVTHIIPLVEKVLHHSGLKKTELDAIAYTAGPGLVGALLVGASFAKSLAFALDIPALGVHHLEAHVLAALLDSPTLTFPFVALIVSGGHTQLIDARALGDYHLLGDTLDDAVGEAFDKTAKAMGLPYPGGPIIAALADGAAQATLPAFPKPMTDRPGLMFSFSGLKTHALQAWQKSNQEDADRIAIARAFQDAVVQTLTIKCQRAIQKMGYKQLVVAGGVGANSALRQALSMSMKQENAHVYFPKLEYCTDNGAMIAYTGCLHLLQGAKDSSHSIAVKARWLLSALF